MSKDKNEIDSRVYQDIKNILFEAKGKAYNAVNFVMIEAYWNVGRRIIEEEQKGKSRAVYGERLLENLSIYLTKELGKGYTEANLRNFRQFYMAFPKDVKIRYALRSELTWAHYLFASKYKIYLPTAKELIKELQREKQVMELNQDD